MPAEVDFCGEGTAGGRVGLTEGVFGHWSGRKLWLWGVFMGLGPRVSFRALGGQNKPRIFAGGVNFDLGRLTV